jgi:hypothetical protein
LEEIRGLGIGRCIGHRSLSDGKEIARQHFIRATSSRKITSEDIGCRREEGLSLADAATTVQVNIL